MMQEPKNRPDEKVEQKTPPSTRSEDQSTAAPKPRDDSEYTYSDWASI